MRLSKINLSTYREINFLENRQLLWQKKFNNAIRIQKLEILMVEKKFREAGTTRIPKDKLKQFISDLSKKNLFFTPISWIKNEEGFAHKHHYTTPDDPQAVCYGAVTSKRKHGELFKQASFGEVDHNLIGSLLGFPKCCRDFFKEVWGKGYFDTVWHQALNTGGHVKEEEVKGKKTYSIEVQGYPECVAHHRYWGARISFHLPCSFQCESTRVLAKQWLKVMDELDPSVTKDLLDILSLPTTWSAYQGAAVIYTPYFKGITNSVPCADLHCVHFSPEPS